jgi:uncharacterized protein (TIGR03437 family)
LIQQTRQSFVFSLFATLLIALVGYGWLAKPQPTASQSHANSTIYGQLPLSFVVQRERAVTRGAGYSVALTGQTAIMQLRQLTTSKDRRQSDVLNTLVTTHTTQVQMQLVNARTIAQATPLAPLPGRVNYFLGNDPQTWRAGVPTYAQVKYEGIYPGIDLLWYGNQRQLEYDFLLAPGVDPRVIELEFAGIERLEIDTAGELLLHTEAGTLRQRQPVVYQPLPNAERRVVDGAYVRTAANRVAFQLGEYDAQLPLVIDPVLVYGTFFGGTGEGELSADIAVDQAGNAYIVGSTGSADFPTANAAQGNLRGMIDVFVAKLNASGNGLVYSTFLGGATSSQGGDAGFGIAVDTNGNAYVTGLTSSSDFPRRNADDNTLSGPVDSFLTKLDPAGALLYSTFVGGNNADTGFDVAVDQFGAAYIVGVTNSTDLASNVRVFTGEGEALAHGEFAEPEQNGLRGPTDGFLIRMQPTGARSYARYLGGTASEVAFSVATDASNGVYIVGNTASRDFPTSNPLQTSYGGGDSDAFVMKLAAGNGTLVYATYLGGSGDETSPFLLGLPLLSYGIAIDGSGSAYVAGLTDSSNFPLRNPLRSSLSGDSEVFLAKLTPTGNGLVYSTFIGGSGFEFTGGVAVDAQGNAYVSGNTNSGDFPQINAISSGLKGEADAFLVKLNPAGSAFVYATLYGGGGGDLATGVATDAQGNAYLFGLTTSGDLPTANPLQASLRGAADTFIAKFGDSGGPPVGTLANVSAASFVGTAVAPDSIVAAFGNGLAVRTEVATVLPLPTNLAGTTVTVRDVNGQQFQAQLFFVAAGQVNYVMPRAATGQATVTITSGNGQISRGTVTVRPTAPGLFTADASGTGLPAAVALRVRANGAQVFEPVARFDAGANRIVAVPIDFGATDDQLFLILYGTGMRFRSNAAATIGGLSSEVLFVGASSFVGVDQANLRLSRNLAGRGEVELALTVDGVTANRVRVSFR